jgi:hypothetical protein
MYSIHSRSFSKSVNPQKPNSPESESDKKPISSLSGERTHGLSSNGSGGNKDADPSKPVNISSILDQMIRINQVPILRLFTNKVSILKVC